MKAGSRDRVPKSNSPKRPSAPYWLLWLGATLVAVVVVLTNLEKIQGILCRHGVYWLCTKDRVTLSLGTWPSDIPGGRNAVITNPTEFSAQIVDATLLIKSKSATPLLISVKPGPSEWQAPGSCTAQEEKIPHPELKPKAATQLRLMLFAGEGRSGNQLAMLDVDKRIPDRMTDQCDLTVNVKVGDGQSYPLTTTFACSRLAYPICHVTPSVLPTASHDNGGAVQKAIMLAELIEAYKATAVELGVFDNWGQPPMRQTLRINRTVLIGTTKGHDVSMSIDPNQLPISQYYDANSAQLSTLGSKEAPAVVTFYSAYAQYRQALIHLTSNPPDFNLAFLNADIEARKAVTSGRAAICAMGSIPPRIFPEEPGAFAEPVPPSCSESPFGH
jgi:hypothetical protein